MQKYAQIVIGAPIEKIFYYAIPEKMAHKVTTGKRVIVPFSGRKLTGYVVGISTKKPNASLREIAEIIDLLPLFDGEILNLTKWVGDYYCCTWGEALRIAFPPRIRAKRESLSQGKCFPAIKLPVHSYFYSEPELLHAATEERLKLYLQRVGQALEHGKRALILAPDVPRSKSIIKAMKSKFGQTISFLYGNLPSGERYKEWIRMKSGISRIVIGTRSAVFAPIENLGLIIVDEENSPFYKEKRTPKYHAREVALKRARLSGTQVILGSKAPSLESYFQTECGEYKLLKLFAKEGERKLPEVKIVNLCHEFKNRKVRWVLSSMLCREIESKLKKGEQIVLFVSRGEGAQRIMDKLKRIFPYANLGKIGSETTINYKKTVSLFRCGKIDILIGTHAVLKELSTKRISLAGIISVDAILNIGNFRAAEKTFQLLMQVVNSFLEKQSSKIIIQTYNPTHYSILNVSNDNYQQFYREEIKFRHQLNYPPFTSLINITTKDKEISRKLIATLEANRKEEPIDILISASSLPTKRWQITLKGKNLSRMREIIRKESITWGKVKVNVDVDPL